MRGRPIMAGSVKEAMIRAACNVLLDYCEESLYCYECGDCVACKYNLKTYLENIKKSL